LPSHRTGL